MGTPHFTSVMESALSGRYSFQTSNAYRVKEYTLKTIKVLHKYLPVVISVFFGICFMLFPPLWYPIEFYGIQDFKNTTCLINSRTIDEAMCVSSDGIEEIHHYDCSFNVTFTDGSGVEQNEDACNIYANCNCDNCIPQIPGFPQCRPVTRQYLVNCEKFKEGSKYPCYYKESNPHFVSLDYPQVSGWPLVFLLAGVSLIVAAVSCAWKIHKGEIGGGLKGHPH